MIQAVQRYLLFCIVFFTISQFGKHFWPYFAYVSGIRVDYLSPVVYLTDILIGLLFLVTVLSSLPVFWRKKVHVSFSVLLLTLALCISIIVAKYPLPALYGATKTLEMVFLGYMISKHLSTKDFSMLCFLLSGAIFIEASLVLMQFSHQSSVGGIWYFLGERTFSVASVGIASVSLGNNEFLRPYGSFPHPNVLAFYMVMGSVFIINHLRYTVDTKLKIWYWISVGIACLCLFLTSSRSSILVFLGIVSYLLVRNYIPRIAGGIILTFGLGFIGVFLHRFSNFSLLSEDIGYRIELAVIALKIITQNFFFGVGINNYFYYQIDYQREITPVLLQPPHNIYLLHLLQVGVVGTIGACYFFYKTILRVMKILQSSATEMYMSAALLFLGIITIGMVDHYFFTLQQGMLILTFAIGILWIPRKNEIRD